MKLILPSILLLCSTLAQADEMVLHVGSIHYQPTYRSYTIWTWVNTRGEVVRTEKTYETHRFNDFNPGIGYKTSGGWTIGTYYNSYREQTFYVGKEFMFTQNFGGVLAGATGYKWATGHTIQPMAALEYKIRLGEGYIANVVATPPMFKSNKIGFAHLALSKEF